LNLNLVPRDEWPFATKDVESFTVGVRGNIEIDNGEALRMAAIPAIPACGGTGTNPAVPEQWPQ
ncbi:hypothetical protein AB9F45_39985, partial [Rhizobium leguminosarum]